MVRFATPVSPNAAAVPGVEDFDIDICTDGITYSKTNIEIGYREKAITEESAVIIE